MSDFYSAWLEKIRESSSQRGATGFAEQRSQLVRILVGRSMEGTYGRQKNIDAWKAAREDEEIRSICKLTKDDNDAQNYARLSNPCVWTAGSANPREATKKSIFLNSLIL